MRSPNIAQARERILADTLIQEALDGRLDLPHTENAEQYRRSALTKDLQVTNRANGCELGFSWLDNDLIVYRRKKPVVRYWQQRS
jgi:hypothetical protein